MRSRSIFITHAALVAALYVALGTLSYFMGLDSGTVQLRFSEALCVLPAVYPPAFYGVTVGCLLFNTIFTGNILDIVFGTLATLIGAVFARMMKKHKYLAFIPSVISNSLIIPFVICFTTMNGIISALPLLALSVAVGEIASCGVLGNLIIKTLDKRKFF